MVLLHDEYIVDGFAQLDIQNQVVNESKQLKYSSIDDCIITETNKEYSYYSKHFYDRVRLFTIDLDFFFI